MVKPVTLFLLVIACVPISVTHAAEPLTLEWEKNYLTIRGNFPGKEIRTHYLEAYCRAGSTDRDWSETVVGHKTERLEPLSDKQHIRLRDTLSDGVIVEHEIKSSTDEVSFQLTATNPTQQVSAAHWAQPCMRVDLFTGTTTQDARELVPAYARRCFLFIEGAPQRLPTQPWAEKARYIPGQVYCPKSVDRNDVNPRPLSSLVPSSGLCGCISADDSMILATAWEPYQEVFQGVIACMHCDFRLGGLKPGETKTIRGKVYLLPNDMPALAARYKRDFGQKP
jgi:hypothetical protein